MKTMLAKEMSLQGVAFKDAYQANSLASAKNFASLDSLEIALKSLTGELKMQSKCLEGFIKLFELYLRHVLNVSIEIPKENTKMTTIRRFKPRSVPKNDDGVGPRAAGTSGAANPKK